jgi:CheY-like chemotaxis protein
MSLEFERTVLLVDDDEFTRSTTSNILNTYGYSDNAIV